MEQNLEATTTQETQEATFEETQAPQEPKTFTAEEMQAEIDRRVTQAMKTAERKANARVKEAEKLAKMNEQQRYEYELESREKAIAEKEQALALAENKATAAQILSDRGISAKLVDFVVAQDAETMNENISLLEAEFKASVKAEVERRLATSTPKKNLPTDKAITQQEFRNLSLTQQAEIWRNNPDLYNQLTH
jgi:hypothetical protein